MKIAFFGDSLTEGIPGIPYVELLQERFPEHTLYNYGRGGDTVLSLYKRMSRLKLPENIDIAFLWVGTNDVLVNISPAYPVVKRLINQPWTRDEHEFAEYYRSSLDFLRERVLRIFTVTPLLIGEDLENDWNRRLARLCGIISELTAGYEQAAYIDLRSIFGSMLSDRKISDYLPESLARVGFDVLGLREPEQIDERSAQRGLHFTLDGVHLNTEGARQVADVFQKRIEDYIRFPHF